METKVCSKCSVDKPLLEYNVCSRVKDGRKAECRECQRLGTKEYKFKNKEKIKEYNPDIMVIGSEYKYQRIVGAKYVPEIEFFEKIDGYSSTKILSYESLSSWGKVF
jgi:hypothetical protein